MTNRSDISFQQQQDLDAALEGDGWNFFLNHIPGNPNHPNASYRIFEPRWKDVFLLWLTREDVPSEQKEQLIKALMEFNDGLGYWNFYRIQAYCLAAAGIARFGSFSSADEIVQHIAKMSIGFFGIREQNREIFSKPLITKKASAALLETDCTKAISALEQVIETLGNLSQSEYVHIRVRTAEILQQLDPSNLRAIETLELHPRPSVTPDRHRLIELQRQCLQSENEDFRVDSAVDLINLSPADPSATEILEELLQSEDLYVRVRAAWPLGRQVSVDPSTIETLEELLQSADLSARVRAAEILIKLNPENLKAIETLLELLWIEFEDEEDNYIAWKAISILEEISSGNARVIETLVQFLLHSQSIETFNALWTLKKSLPRAQMPGVIATMKDYLLNEADRNIYWHGYYCCEILWHCAQSLPYPIFYQVWHSVS